MDMNSYQKLARSTAIYPDKGSNLIYPTLGLVGEAGEVAEKIKKLIRDKGGVLDDETKASLINELGDVLWYIANLAEELEVNLSTIGHRNLVKLAKRKKENKLHGEGDNR